jgi:hypothetical protein
MLAILVSLAVGVLGGALAGAVAGWLTGRRSSAQSVVSSDVLGPDLDAQITEAARQWATRQGQPAAAPLVADKLRLIHALSLRRRRARRTRRWSR